MKTKLIMPQEVEVFYLIPAIRREMAHAMKIKGRKQKEIARLLCVEESTVSQYLNDKRASTLRLSEEVKEAVMAATYRITDKPTLVGETQKILARIRQENMLCSLHQSLAGLPKDCDACMWK